ncbi:DUF4197 domain-containing protein [Desulfuromonas sp. TF]|uniref:DUF4197 domain-containing protein n=1 Tax=Desulfuromonas sp. TF TaxID=1232410 RepID=UPI000429CFFE|nr:DUF4197 domain-containing protein [Desulfuromonas sp. TF]
MSLRNNDWIKVAAIIAIATLLLPSPSWSQTDWLQRGRELFGMPEKGSNAVTTSQVAAGLKEALRVGSENVVGKLGRPDGFAADPAIHIPLPKSLQTVQTTLKPLGMAYLLDDLELKLNRAAEQATPKAKGLFWTAIEQMTLDDVMGIYNGPPDAATRYFQKKMSVPLGEEMRPIVDQTLDQTGAVQAYDNVMGKYRNVPFVPDVRTDLTGYVVEQGMNGIFHYLAEEEAAIRMDPAKRTTELLKTVFGSK